MKENTHVVIHSFMRKDLNLCGNELLVYAIIYGFSQDGESLFYGSQQYLADWCGLSVRQVQRILDSLVEKKLIIKQEQYYNGNKKCLYFINDVDDTDVVMDDKMSCVDDKMSLNNIDNNISNNKLLDNTSKKSKKFDYQACIEEIKLRYSSNETLMNKLVEYLNYLLSIHTLSYTKQWISRLDKLDSLQGDKVSIVSQSLTNDWKTFYDVKANYRSRSNDRPQDGCGIESVKKDNLDLVDKVY